MTQQTIFDVIDRPQKVSLCDRLAAHLKAHEGEWIDGLDLGTVAGSYAWRSRLAQLRFPPFNMDIRNRQRRFTRGDGSRFTVSEYMLVTAKEHAA